MKSTQLAARMVAFAALLMLIAACGASAPAAEQTAAPAAQTAEAPTTADAPTEAAEAPTTAAAPTTETAAAAELHVLNWQGYGSDEPWAIEQFEKEHNVKIVHDYYTSLDEMLTKLRTSPGTYDAVQMNIAYIQPALEDELIQPIDTSKIAAWESIPEDFRNLPELTQSQSDVYAMPWAWGATSLVYNPEVIPGGIDSLAALWDPQYAGKIGLGDFYEDATILAALKDGIANPANPAEADLPAIQTSLEQLVPNVRAYWQSEDEFNRLFQSGEIALGIYWSGSASRAQNAFDIPIEFVIPKEGAIGWIDAWTIAADAPNAEMAAEWISFMSSPEFYLEWDKRAGAPVPANGETLEQLPEDSFTRRVFGNPEVTGQLAFQTYITPEKREDLLAMWQEVKVKGAQ